MINEVSERNCKCQFYRHFAFVLITVIYMIRYNGNVFYERNRSMIDEVAGRDSKRQFISHLVLYIIVINIIYYMGYIIYSMRGSCQ